MNRQLFFIILALLFLGCGNSLSLMDAEIYKVNPGQADLSSENVLIFSFSSDEPVNIGEWVELRTDKILKLPITSILDKSNTFRKANSFLEAGKYRIEVKSSDSSYMMKEGMIFYVLINGKYLKLKPVLKESLKMK
jgi:hypothetical protein